MLGKTRGWRETTTIYEFLVAVCPLLAKPRRDLHDARDSGYVEFQFLVILALHHRKPEVTIQVAA